MNVSLEEQATLFILVPCGQRPHPRDGSEALPRIRNVTPSQVNPVRYPSAAMLDHSLACRCVALPNDRRQANFIFRFVIPRPACDDSRKGSTSTRPRYRKPSPTESFAYEISVWDRTSVLAESCYFRWRWLSMIFSAYLTAVSFSRVLSTSSGNLRLMLRQLPASVSLYFSRGAGITVAAGAALRPHWSPPRTTGPEPSSLLWPASA